MEVRVAIRKMPRSGYPRSGDSVQMVERPRGGLSLILADGQGHGEGARRISNLVVNRTAMLLAEGTRDGAAARAVHDYLHAWRDGRVSSTLTILSVDLRSGTLLVSRNSETPVLVRQGGEVRVLAQEAPPIGVRTHVKPVVEEMPLLAGSQLLAFTDGLLARDKGLPAGPTLERAQAALAASDPGDPDRLAEEVLGLALGGEGAPPRDDVAVAVLAVVEAAERRLSVFSRRLPL